MNPDADCADGPRAEAIATAVHELAARCGSLDPDKARGAVAHRGLLGIRIDEDTAALVRGDGLTVPGSSQVLITVRGDHAGVPYPTPPRGPRFDLAQRAMRPAPR